MGNDDNEMEMGDARDEEVELDEGDTPFPVDEFNQGSPNVIENGNGNVNDNGDGHPGMKVEEKLREVDESFQNKIRNGGSSVEATPARISGRLLARSLQDPIIGRFSNSKKRLKTIDGDEEAGTKEEQAEFMKELEAFYKERHMDLRPPKFYGEPLNLLKYGYGDQLFNWVDMTGLHFTSFGGKLENLSIRQTNIIVVDFFSVLVDCLFLHWIELVHGILVRTCTTVSWTFRIFYEKVIYAIYYGFISMERDEEHYLSSITANCACSCTDDAQRLNVFFFMQSLLEYEKHKIEMGEVEFPDAPFPEHASGENEGGAITSSGRARRESATRAMQGWHSQRQSDCGEDGEPIVKDKNHSSSQKREKHLKNIGVKQRKPNNMVHEENDMQAELNNQLRSQLLKDCFEVYVLVPGLLREEVNGQLVVESRFPRETVVDCHNRVVKRLHSAPAVRVQSDASGRVVITGTPEQLDNPWGITPFKKIVNLPARIDTLHTSAVVSLHGRLFVRVPFAPPIQ
ncbi:hypothetical protein KSS87_013182 [Heliosperma pusillum]|nr:hypothetical protein KSS87_013182 [Heliosperma pusillum]